MIRHFCSTIAFAMAIVGVTIGIANAGSVIVSRSSSIMANGSANDETGGGIPYSNTDSTASNFATFDSSVSGATASPTGKYAVDSDAMQRTSLSYFLSGDLKAFEGTGSASAHEKTLFPPPAGGGSGGGDSFFDVFFDITVAPTLAFFNGSVTTHGDHGEHALIMLDKIGDIGSIASVESYGDLSLGASLSSGFLLLPGSYHLSAGVVSDASTGPPGSERFQNADFNVSLTFVPEPHAAVIGLLGFAALLRRRH